MFLPPNFSMFLQEIPNTLQPLLKIILLIPSILLMSSYPPVSALHSSGENQILLSSIVLKLERNVKHLHILIFVL